MSLPVKMRWTWKPTRPHLVAIADAFCQPLKQAGNQTQCDQYGSDQYTEHDLVQFDHMTIITFLPGSDEHWL